MIVGEAPGAREDAIGKPFQGGSGQLLDQMLNKVGILRRDCFITNVCHLRPPGNDFKWFYRKSNALHFVSGVLQLKDDIEQIKPNLVLGLGGAALRVLTGKSGITDWRGSLMESTLVSSQKVLCSIHPAAILRVYDYRPVVEFDLARAKIEREFPELRLPARNHIINPTGEAREKIIDEMLQAEWLAIDIECSTKGDWPLLCVGFSDRAGRGLVIPINSPQDFTDTKRLCESPVPKVFQNGSFDVTVLMRHGITVRNFAWDTMLAHHALFTECASGQDEMSRQTGTKRSAAIQKGLAFQTSIYTKEPYYKADGKLWHESGDKNLLYLYNSRDTTCTREIRDVQEGELLSFGTWDVFKHEMSLIEPLLYATTRGIKIDLPRRAQFERELLQHLEQAQRELDAKAGITVNVKSNKQVADLLFGRLGLPTVKRSEKTGKPSADKDVIAELGRKHDHPVLRAIISIREIRDLLERYIAAPIDADGRMRCSFDITGTRTGRLSSRQSIWGSGTNLQNQPALIRRLFIPDEGKVFLSCDYSQAEARIVAYLADCQALIELFEDPSRDIHKENASRIFGVPLELVTYALRYTAKRCLHAMNYGMRAKRFSEIVNQDTYDSPIFLDGTLLSKGSGVSLTVPEAQTIGDKYMQLYPEIRERFWEDVQREISRSRMLNTPFGRKRLFFGRPDNHKFMNEAYAYIPQSTVGDLCCKALVKMYKRFQQQPTWGAEVLCNVHDSLLVQCAEDSAHDVAKAMMECMNIPIPIGRHDVRIPTDCKLGHNWGDASDANPRGLKDYDPA